MRKSWQFLMDYRPRNQKYEVMYMEGMIQYEPLEQIMTSEKGMPLLESINIVRSLLKQMEEIQKTGHLYLEQYMLKTGFRPPEVAMGYEERIGKQSDYYFAAAVFYYCLTGKKITRLQMFRSGIPDISGAICQNSMKDDAVGILYRILKKGLAPVLRNRYQSLEQMEEDFAKLEMCYGK